VLLAKDFCQEYYPEAAIERHQTNIGDVYYLIRKDNKAAMYLMAGRTKAEAWTKLAVAIKAVNAAKEA
jgi:hypothetical protein